MSIAYYPGSFDPMTNGHLDVLQGALRIAGHVVVGIGIQASKTPLFSFDDRKTMILAAIGNNAGRVSVESFSGLVRECGTKGRCFDADPRRARWHGSGL